MTRSELGSEEGARRRRNVIELLVDCNLDGLLVFGLGTKFQLHQYLTQSRAGLAALLTREGTVIEFSRNMSDLSMDDYLRNVIEIDVIDPWRDKLVKGGHWGKAIVSELRSQGLDDAAIGVVGLGDPGVALEPEGWIPYRSWKTIETELPGARFEDVTRRYIERILPKSRAEIEALKVAAEAGEAACEAVLSAAKAGVRENELFAKAMATMYERGVSVEYEIFHTLPGGKGLPWGNPAWQFRTQRPRIIRPGDVILTELFPNYGGLEAQQQLTVGVEPVHEDCKRATELAEESLARGIDAAKPGTRFGEVCDAMEEPLLEADAGWLTPLVHTLNPIYGIGRSGVNIEFDGRPADTFMHDEAGKHVAGDLELTEGMLLEFEPNAVLDRRRINIGGTFVVTDRGVEPFEEVPMTAHFV